MAVAEGVIVDAQPMGNAGPEILNNHVGVLRQRPRFVHAVRGLEIDDDAFLASVPLDGTGSVPELFSPGRLDLDDLSAEVGHHHGGDTTSAAAGEVEDCDAIKDLCHGSPYAVGWLLGLFGCGPLQVEGQQSLEDFSVGKVTGPAVSCGHGDVEGGMGVGQPCRLPIV